MPNAPGARGKGGRAGPPLPLPQCECDGIALTDWSAAQSSMKRALLLSHGCYYYRSLRQRLWRGSLHVWVIGSPSEYVFLLWVDLGAARPAIYTYRLHLWSMYSHAPPLIQQQLPFKLAILGPLCRIEYVKIVWKFPEVDGIFSIKKLKWLTATLKLQLPTGNPYI